MPLGYPEPREKWWLHSHQTFQYAQILDQVRDAGPDAGPAKVGEFLHGPEHHRLAWRANTYVRRIRAWLAKTWPDEEWVVYMKPTPDAHKGADIWVEFHGQKPPGRRR